jgi:hypothetical protein
MFRSNVFEPTLTGIPYRIFIEGLKSALKIDNPKGKQTKRVSKWV